MRPSLSYANVMASIAVLIAIGGTSYAALTLPRNSVHAKQLAKNSVTSPKVKNHSLLAVDFKNGQLHAGAQGAQGAQGPQGVQGPTGTVDTSSFYDKTASDARFLGIGATAANSSALGGLAAATYPKTVEDTNFFATTGHPVFGVARRSVAGGVSGATLLQVGLLGELKASCSDPAQPSLAFHETQGTAADVVTQNMVSGSIAYQSVAANGNSTLFTGSAGVQGAARVNIIVGSGATTTSSTARVAVFDVTMVTAPGGVADNTCLFEVVSHSFTP